MILSGRTSRLFCQGNCRVANVNSFAECSIGMHPSATFTFPSCRATLLALFGLAEELIKSHLDERAAKLSRGRFPVKALFMSDVEPSAYCYYDYDRGCYVYQTVQTIVAAQPSPAAQEPRPQNESASTLTTLHGRTESNDSSNCSISSGLSSLFENISLERNFNPMEATPRSTSLSSGVLVGPGDPSWNRGSSYASYEHPNPPLTTPTGCSPQLPLSNPTRAFHGWHQDQIAPPNPQAREGTRPSRAMPYQNTQERRDNSQPSDPERLQVVSRNVVMNPGTPPDLLQLGITPHRQIRGNSESTREKLDSSFCIRRPGHKFFKKGLVFRVLWPELAGDMNQNITVASTPRFEGENFFVKVRWFVVVREVPFDVLLFPLTLSIQTYRGRGVPENKVKKDHAIMYTGDVAPLPLPSEEPRGAWELPMGDPIRVIGKNQWGRMDPMSRVNFLKVYTVEHNVKIDDFGYVDRNDEWKLITQFNSHWNIGPLSHQVSQPDPSLSNSSETAQGYYAPSHAPSYAPQNENSQGPTDDPSGNGFQILNSTGRYPISPIPENTRAYHQSLGTELPSTDDGDDGNETEVPHDDAPTGPRHGEGSGSHGSTRDNNNPIRSHTLSRFAIECHAVSKLMITSA
ncbi:uncharacterized protein BDR25DRAFT_394411 [Lindgomyces ingoldianus]|uniref:Uncharacterized protein n=1 Tax=Lindgomyces ingoldianus TaxID=673940 RepID=A0ACB6QRD8_9PLEO|nr:uncharacterized protein BDR25DRAFT_394411 [Lindgomyces ingoldianus]KAF2469455.1 hypothetical protein BDR25DRAFT_394411 [Lindgomyces ingoldianus]